MKNRLSTLRLGRRARQAFTLLEVLIAISGLSVLSLIFTSVYLDCYKVAFVSDERNQINRDIRTITGELSHYARASNYFLLYRSFASEDRDTVGDQLAEGNAGDLLVLVYQGDADIMDLSAARPTMRIVGYYRAPAGTSFSGPVRKFDIAIAEDDREKPIETLLPSASLINTFPKVIELSEGLADGRLFYNLWGRSVMVNGKILHGNAAKRVTDTYNFTVSPRGQQG
jgi:hypothetical protein